METRLLEPTRYTLHCDRQEKYECMLVGVFRRPYHLLLHLCKALHQLLRHIPLEGPWLSFTVIGCAACGVRHMVVLHAAAALLLNGHDELMVTSG